MWGLNMIGWKTVLRFTSLAILGAGLAMAPAAQAARSPSPEQLASTIESALGAEGCGASGQADVSAIETAIAESGAKPEVALKALRDVQSWASLCGADGTAVSTVEGTIIDALAGNAVPHAGGPGGGVPIGTPASFVSGGGSNYTP